MIPVMVGGATTAMITSENRHSARKCVSGSVRGIKKAVSSAYETPESRRLHRRQEQGRKTLSSSSLHDLSSLISGRSYRQYPIRSRAMQTSPE